MFLWREPSTERLHKFVTTQRESSYSYSEIGATEEEPPSTYAVDHNRIKLGYGLEAFTRAVEALKAWSQFDIGWVKVVPKDAVLEPGTTVAILVRHFGFWSLNAVRIVYVVDEDSSPRRYGFAYGTLIEHAECGEERFTIELLEDGSVWYDILAFSRPHHILSRLGCPLARLLQRRFVRHSMRAMVSYYGASC